MISVIARSGPRGPIRYVLWCSLRAAGECSEDCLAQAAPRRPGGVPVRAEDAPDR